ncbi:hypothetical protein HKD37_20G055610 [Glycine soja]
MAPISKKLCGRPNGSKNKPKSTSRSICQPIESSVKLVMINVVSGKGVMETILDVACCDHVSLTVLNAFGMIKNVIICNPPQGATHPPPFSFAFKLCTSHGQVFDGLIGGSIIVGDNVSLMVSTFKKPNIYKFISEGKEGNNDDNNV